MNPLENYPKIRQHLYLVQWLGNGILAIIAAVLLVMEQSPVWFVATAAGWNAFCTYTGFTAQQNTPASDAEIQRAVEEELYEGRHRKLP